jgi:hypothetical protein
MDSDTLRSLTAECHLLSSICTYTAGLLLSSRGQVATYMSLPPYRVNILSSYLFSHLSVDESLGSLCDVEAQSWTAAMSSLEVNPSATAI